MNSFTTIILVLTTFSGVNGLGNRQLSPRIVGGKFAKRGQYPYQVGLDLNIIPGVLTKWCGGSLLSKNFVLSAAHCLYGQRYELLTNGSVNRHRDQYQWIWSLDAYIGGNDLKKEEEYQIIHVPANPNFIIHPQFNLKAFRNDIALIHLPKPAVLNEFIKIINLPPPNIGDLVGRVAIATGYGVTNTTTWEDSKILKFVKLEIIGNDECFKLEETRLCTKTINQQNICRGDSGGPLALKNEKGETLVVGVVASGYPICEESSPAYFTRVSSYLDWIKEKMKQF